LSEVRPQQEYNSTKTNIKGWFSLLADRINSLSIQEATFGCILPDKEYGFLSQQLNKLGWQIARIQKLLPYPGGDKIRILAEWKRSKENCVAERLPDIYVRNDDKEFSQDYKKLTQDFYLKF
jgi:tRNA1(Val) A37 N6-methylase TrmN6